MDKNLRAFFYTGLFVLSFCLLACQFLLTRILSLVFSYHFVFLIISVVMFGLTVGSLIVYGAKKIRHPQDNFEQIARCSLCGGFTLLCDHLSLFYLPAFLIQNGISPQNTIYIYLPILAVPFVFFGIALSFLLTRFPEEIGKAYAVNLSGSAAGCIGAYFILNGLNAISAACVLSALCLLAGILFLMVPGKRNKRHISLYALGLICLLFAGYCNQKVNLVEPLWSKDNFFPTPPLYSKLNFFSYVSIRYPTHKPFGWGYSPKVRQVPINTQELMILIDDGAGTVLTRFHDLSDLGYLKYDISNLPYRIRPYDSVIVMGSGGGRDLLSAVLFKAKKITGVELNKDIMDITLERSFRFDGHIRNIPQIKIHNDDGRAFIARSHAQYDLIQSSLVDSFSASAMGAFALSENSLYTKEAWIIYLRHLTDRGVMTFSRWYFDDSLEIYRLLSLAQSALKAIGITGDIRRHVILVRTRTSDFVDLRGDVARSKLAVLRSIRGTVADPDNKKGIWESVSAQEVRLKTYRHFKREDFRNITESDINEIITLLQYTSNVGTIMVSRTPFSPQELDKIDKVCKDLGFEVVLNGRKSMDGNFDRILAGNYQLNDSRADISPPTDDRPFYFYFSYFKDFFSNKPIGAGPIVLRQTSVLIAIFGFLFIFFPFIFTPQQRGFGRIGLWHSTYFAGIGFGFMFLEIPLIQRLGLYLGHPVYGLTVVLFSLLLACGAGSFIASRTTIKQVFNIGFPCLFFLILFMAFALPCILWQTTQQVIPVKILISGAAVVSIGLFMGLFFPTGVSVVSRDPKNPLIFYWAVNGFCSMCAAAFATIFLINAGFHAALLCALLFYFIAFYALSKDL